VTPSTNQTAEPDDTTSTTIWVDDWVSFDVAAIPTGSNSFLVEWEDVNEAVGYEIIVNGETIARVDPTVNSFEIARPGPDDEVIVRARFQSARALEAPVIIDFTTPGAASTGLNRPTSPQPQPVGPIGAGSVGRSSLSWLATVLMIGGSIAVAGGYRRWAAARNDEPDESV
jgi:hypothetical protein